MAPLFAFGAVVSAAIGALGGALAVTESPAFALLALPFVLLTVAASWLWWHHPAAAEVGPDGVHLRRRGLDRYVAFAELVDVEDGNRGTRLTLRDGEVLRMFPQAIEASASLVAGIEDRWNRADDGPVVLHGRSTQPVVYATFLGLFIPGGFAALWAVTNPANGSGRWTALAFGLGCLAVGFGYWYWFLFRWQRSVTIDGTTIARDHLVGVTTEPLGEIVRVALVSVPNRLPKSSLERMVHRLRLTRRDGTAALVGPAASSFPDYPSDAERLVLERAAHRIRQQTGIDGLPAVRIVHTLGAACRIVIVDHGERSAGADQTTVVVDPPVDGRRVFTAWGANATMSGTGAWLAVWTSRHVLVAKTDGSEAGLWTAPDGRVVSTVDEHPARVITSGPGGSRAHDLDDLRKGPLADVPADGALDASPGRSLLPWSATLPRLLAAIEGAPDDGADRAGALVAAWAFEDLATFARNAAAGRVTDVTRDDAAWQAIADAADAVGDSVGAR